MSTNHFYTDRPPQPPVLSSFEHINRYWDKVLNVWAAKILPGEFYVSCHGEMIVTVLGSCIACCIRDRKLGIGGMNHFMLPAQNEYSTDHWGSCEISSSTRYGNWAMEYLINEIIKRGGNKANLEIKFFGGGQVIKSMTDIGQRNILFTYDYLRSEGLKAAAQDVGDIYSRKVLFFSDTGSVKLRKFTSAKNDTIIRREKAYMDELKTDKQTQTGGGDVELF